MHAHALPDSAHRLARRLLLVLAGAALLAAATPAAVAADTAGTARPAATGGHRPSGIDLAGMDRSVRPGDDFFAFANGLWAKRATIPPDRAGWGIFWELAEQTGLRTRGLLEAAAKAPTDALTRQVGDYYASFMDEAAIEARGRAPLKPVLARIAAVRDQAGLAQLLGEDLRADVDPLNNTEFHTSRLFGLWVSPDLNAPQRNVPYLLQGGLGLPDRAYYLEASPRMATIRAAYQAHIAAVFALAGVPDGPARAARILALETKLAKVHATRQESMEVRTANNPWPRTEFPRRAPGLDWSRFFRGAGLTAVPTIIVWHPRATAGLAALVAREPLAAWKDWASFHAIDRLSSVLPRAFVAEHFAFYGKTLTGTPQLRARWKRGVSATNAALGDAVGQLYVKRYFPAASKLQLQRMVQGIIHAFGRRIDRLRWMTPATKARAKAKLATLYVGIGYPERWHDYSGLVVRRGDALGNHDRAERFEYRQSLAKLGRPVDRTEWSMTPQTVNAVNLPLQNGLNFPAAILQPPFFDPQAPAATNYGSIGAVIGHEISHSFDDQGAQFDAQGRLTDWWTKVDRKRFEAAGARLVAQYDAYRPFPDLHINGKLTLSENLADLAGLAAAHDAWRAAGGRAAKGADGLTGEQLFFLAFAQSWRGKLREATLRRVLITDGHSPSAYRAATVRNLDAWYRAFGVKAGQKLYLAPRDRVRVW